MKKSIWKRPGFYLFLALAVLSIVTLVQLGILGVLPVQVLAIAGVVIVLVDALLYLMLVSQRINKVNRALCRVCGRQCVCVSDQQRAGQYLA